MATDIRRQPLGHTPLFTHSEVLLAMQDALMFCPIPCTMKIRCPMGGSLSSLGGGRLGEGGGGEVNTANSVTSHFNQCKLSLHIQDIVLQFPFLIHMHYILKTCHFSAGCHTGGGGGGESTGIPPLPPDLKLTFFFGYSVIH